MLTDIANIVLTTIYNILNIKLNLNNFFDGNLLKDSFTIKRNGNPLRLTQLK